MSRKYLVMDIKNDKVVAAFDTMDEAGLFIDTALEDLVEMGDYDYGVEIFDRQVIEESILDRETKIQNLSEDDTLE